MAESGEAPSWLHEDNDAPAVTEDAGLDPTTSVATTTTVPTNAASTTNGAAATSINTTTNPEDEDLPRTILLMRLANMGAAIALMVCAILEIIDNPGKIGAVVLAIYALCGGLLICCLETQLKFVRIMIALNFGFLFNAILRFLFNGLLGSVAFTMNGLFGKIVGTALGAVGLFNTYVLCKYPTYRKMREKIAQEEDKRIEERIRKEVKKQAVAQMTS